MFRSLNSLNVLELLLYCKNITRTCVRMGGARVHHAWWGHGAWSLCAYAWCVLRTSVCSALRLPSANGPFSSTNALYASCSGCIFTVRTPVTGCVHAIWYNVNNNFFCTVLLILCWSELFLMLLRFSKCVRLMVCYVAIPAVVSWKWIVQFWM